MEIIKKGKPVQAVIEENNLDLSSQKVVTVAVIISIFAHLAIFGAVRLSQLFKSEVIVQQEENYVDLGYETFDEVPLPKPIIAESHEIQDENSEVVGLQKKKDPPIERTTASAPVTDVPYYKIKPKYPRDALESGLEGYVNLEVDVLEDGTVENIKVTGGEKLMVFETAAKRAVAKWKYRPFIDEAGQTIRKKNHLVRVDFKLTDESVSTN
jgi:TonB family protein